MITVSLCMIVKNEETVLARCLDSLKDLMDEIIIVDTGSTDNTKAIAARYTDQIYDYEWSDNFADARNYSFSKAGMDYIYCADADELLDSVNQQRFLELKQTLLPEIEVVQMKYSGQLNHNTVYNYDEEYRPKLYKRLRTFRFTDPVHEIVKLEPVVYDSDICIFHKPHSPHTSRDLLIYQKHYGNGASAAMPRRLLEMYTKELYISGTDQDFIDARPIFESLASEAGRTSQELMMVYCILAHTFRLQGNAPAFFKYAMKAVADDGCSEACMELGWYYESIGDLNEAYHWYSNAAFDHSPVSNIHLGGDTALLSISRVLQNAGYPQEAADYQKKAEKWQKISGSV